VTDRVYERLRDCADAALSAGFNALVDASFLRAAQRERFRQLAVERRVPFLILSCHADAAALDARLKTRAHAGRDASEATRAVLEYQLATQQPLSAAEREQALVIDTNWITGAEAGVEAVRSRLHPT
jgi:predicted kinase